MKKTKSMVLWATYDNCMSYAKSNSQSNAEYEYLLKSANKILDKWFLAVEDERRTTQLQD